MSGFIVGDAWRKKAVGDDPSIDWSICDDWVCPIHYRFEDFGVKRFVLDVEIDCDPDMPSAPALVKHKAQLICHALNMMSENEYWIDYNIGFLIGA